MRVWTVLLLLSAATLLCAPTCMGGKAPDVRIELTYPAGKSPKVFTSGWLFGAKATADGKDISRKVQWSGTGKFAPAKGTRSRPTFRRPGSNSIVLSVEHAGERFSKKFAVNAVSPDKYAAVGDMVICPSDSHGCPSCPHSVKGHIAKGSPNILVRGKPAARKGDGGHHASCCGPNTFKIAGGDLSVLIDGKPAARKGDKTQHCGGIGQIGTAGGQNGTEVFSGPAGPSTLSLTINGSVVGGAMSSTQAGVRSSGSISGSYDRKTGKINARVTGTTRITMNGSSGGSTWSGPLTGRRVDDEVTGTFEMTVRAGDQTMSDTIPVKLRKVN